MKRLLNPFELFLLTIPALVLTCIGIATVPETVPWMRWAIPLSAGIVEITVFTAIYYQTPSWHAFWHYLGFLNPFWCFYWATKQAVQSHFHPERHLDEINGLMLPMTMDLFFNLILIHLLTLWKHLSAPRESYRSYRLYYSIRETS